MRVRVISQTSRLSSWFAVRTARRKSWEICTDQDLQIHRQKRLDRPGCGREVGLGRDRRAVSGELSAFCAEVNVEGDHRWIPGSWQFDSIRLDIARLALRLICGGTA